MILVTGANGFVGTDVCRSLAASRTPYRAAVRQYPQAGQIAVGSIDAMTDWRAALSGCTAVIHLAARVHVMADDSTDPLADYHRVNVDGSLNLARQAVAAGVKRFVFVSSVKVNGEATQRSAFTAQDSPAPADPYGQSKMEAEAALLKFGRESGLEIVVVRPPLVYGPGVKANFLNLIKLVRMGLPLPLGCANAHRSMVAVENLTDLLILCCTHPQAPGQTFMVSDGIDYTVADLTRLIATAMGKRAILIPVPASWMETFARMVGKSAIADRLFRPLCVNITATKERLNWTPRVSAGEALNRTIIHFLRDR